MKKQRGSLTWVAALFLLSVMVISSFISLNTVRAEDVRVESSELAEDIFLLNAALAIHYQLTCAVGVIPNDDIVGVYFPQLRRFTSLDDYSLEISQVGRNAFLTVRVLISSLETKYTGKAISQGAVLNGNILTKRSPLTLYQNSRVSLITLSNDIQRVSNC